ncbi:rhodanese-like domain-containing protein [Nocardia sp. NPDC051833]|uniref:sulfurtransferase n=1 Tax=Nocardia sp. NPDC051833 TaxID=3155674 RepID=UPI003445462F
MGLTFPHTVSVSWLRDHLGEPGLLVVDASTRFTVHDDGTFSLEPGRTAYAAAQVPGAVFADLLTDFADPTADQPVTAPDSARFAAAAGALGIGDGVRVVVYDQDDGMWATRFWWQLRLEGFDDVAVLDGGLPAWQTTGGEVSSFPVPPTPVTFTPRRRPGLLRSTAEVRAAIDDDGSVLVGVLDPAVYRGDTEVFARPGHIPASINLPIDRIRDPRTGTLRPLAELRTLFATAGLLDSTITPVTYCGGGVAATAVAHALALLGRDDVAVYDGSLTAWTADPTLPLTLGDQPG